MDARAAAANNAAWCDLVCQASGLPTSATGALWSTASRSPAAYPDAVTLRPGLRADLVLAAIDDSPGASVKDSFADLDLSPHGYALLFVAQWLVRPPGPVTTPVLAWRTVDAGTLPRWLAAHGSTSIRAGASATPGCAWCSRRTATDRSRSPR